jgi:hypothetical protein
VHWAYRWNFFYPADFKFLNEEKKNRGSSNNHPNKFQADQLAKTQGVFLEIKIMI